MELLCSFQNYHWGKKGRNSLVGRMLHSTGCDIDENQPYAELWMGTHPNGPSELATAKIKLSEHLMHQPSQLGAKVVNTFGNQLPFLFKILSVDEPLSIQAHPTKLHAEQLFKNYPNIYKDKNHKPELAVALTKFEALCGFRPVPEIKHFLRITPEFRLLIEPNKIDNFLLLPEENTEQITESMKYCFQSLMLCEKDVVESALDKLIARLDNLSFSEKEECLYALVKRIHLVFPKDVGVFCVYWFNYLHLSPGEALYLAPNEPHAYLNGDCIECMANSDNVVRAGLTTKFRDVSTLCKMLTYKNYKPTEILFQPIVEDEYCQLYSPPVKDFAVVKISIPKLHYKYKLKARESASILIVVGGFGELNSTHRLTMGKAFFIPADTECCIDSDRVDMFQAFCNI